MRQIKESDWKILRKLHRIALERFCERVLEEIDRIKSDSTKSFHEKYLDIYDVTRRRDKEMARIFDNLRRSVAFEQLALMKGYGLLTEEELSQFSQETRNLVEVLLGNS
jgi:hypothetical protein